MRVRLTEELFSMIGTKLPVGTELELGEKTQGETLSVADNDRWSLWTLDRDRIVVPYADPDWFEECL